MDLKKIQQFLKEQQLDGWLIADFHARNSVAVELLALKGIVTRRSFYFIPQQGSPTAVVHAIEREKFQHLSGEKRTYSSYDLLEQELATLLSGCKKVAMEYSPKGRLPYIGLVDAGTVELVRGMQVEVVSSADLVANFQARLSAEQIAAHQVAAGNVMQIKDKAFTFIAQHLSEHKSLTEYDVSCFILDQFDRYEMTTEHPPICAVDANAGNPHYEPTADKTAEIKIGQLILIDLWAKIKHPNGVYADITWMAYTGKKTEIPSKYNERFAVLLRARDKTVLFIQDNVAKKPVYGFQVDDVCRAVIKEAGYGDYFTHCTGHSITSAGHGPGPNIDNLETEDRRRLQPGHLFSIEPGIYQSDCGLRTEINVLITTKGAEITTLPLQNSIVPLF
ncbi:MAG: M24 family metallopeptidase [Candidatus Zixiibacteriota bacterium]